MRLAVVGSGPTGVAAAMVLSERGFEVELFDGGHSPPDGPVEPSRAEGHAPRFSDILRRRLDSRRARKRVRGSDFAFSSVDEVAPMTGGWVPRSLAVGGLSHVWGTACYPLTSDDQRDWPIPADALKPWYERAARYLSVMGEEDGLAGAYAPNVVRAPADLAGGSGLQPLLGDWRGAANELQHRGIFAGRARLAVDPDACTACGSCLSGCPTGAMWTALVPLSELGAKVIRRHGAVVRRTETGEGGETVVVGGPGEAEERRGPFQAVFLAAGPLGSLAIAQQSIGVAEAPRAIVDNDLYVVPFLLRRHRHAGPQRFQLSEAAIALTDATDPLVHVQLYRPGTSLLGPFGPFGRVLEPILSRLVLGFLYLHSDVSRSLTLTPSGAGPFAGTRLETTDRPAARAAFRRATRRLVAAADPLGLRPLPMFSLRGDPGLSGHVGGTLPMRVRPGPLETDPQGRLAGDREIYAVDLSVFPKMPAQNPTFAAVANAMRVASDWADRVAA